MTRFDPDTLTLGHELDRLRDRYDDLLDELDDAEPGTPTAQMLQQELRDVAQEGSEVEWLIDGGEDFDGYGEDAEITVRGLHAGEYARTENRTADAQDRATSSNARGTGKLIFAAAGLVDAPWLGDGHPYIDRTLDPDSEDDRIESFAGTGSDHGLPIGVRKWVEDLVSERTQRSGNWHRSGGRSRGADSAS